MTNYKLIKDLGDFGTINSTDLIAVSNPDGTTTGSATISGLFGDLDELRTGNAIYQGKLLGGSSPTTGSLVPIEASNGLVVSGSSLLGVNASTTAKGVVMFDPDHFTTSSGSVSITNVATTGTIPIDHDRLENFVSNEHIDHSGVAIGVSGTGLSGGGTIEANRTITLDSSTSTGTNNKVPLTNASGGGSGNGYLNNFVQNLLYIQAVGKDNDVTASTITSYFFVPNYLANKSIKRMGIGYTGSQPTSSTVQIRNNTTTIVSQSTTSSAIYAEGDVSGTMPPLGTKLNVYVSAISGGTPKGLDVWILVG